MEVEVRMNQKYTILIIDDIPTNIRLAANTLKNEGYDVLISDNAEQGILVAELKQPDIILLDVFMPDIDGFEACYQLKHRDSTKNIPVIFLTSANDIEKITQGFKLGAVDYITKPFNNQELIARVKAMILLVESFRKNEEQMKIIHQQEKELMIQKEEFLKREIELKNNEIALITINFIQYKEKYLEMFKEIREAVKTCKTHQDQDAINKILNNFDKTIEDDSWKRIEHTFTQNNPLFLKTIIDKFPDLSPAEIKLAMFLRLNLSSKDIATFMGLTPDSVKVARSRLRKKLKLENDTNLVSFLLSI